MEQVEQDAVVVQDMVDEVRNDLVASQNALVYAERDHRRIMLGGDEILKYFSAQGADGVRRLLSAWSDSYRREVEPSCRNWAAEIANCQVFVIPFTQGMQRVVVDVAHKLARDELC